MVTWFVFLKMKRQDKRGNQIWTLAQLEWHDFTVLFLRLFSVVSCHSHCDEEQEV